MTYFEVKGELGLFAQRSVDWCVNMTRTQWKTAIEFRQLPQES